MFETENPPLIAFMKKVFLSESGSNTILRIYLSRSDNSTEGIPPGLLFAICQIKTASTQAVIDCLLSEDCIPLEPVWYSSFCEQLIDEHRGLLYQEIVHLATATLILWPWYHNYFMHFFSLLLIRNTILTCVHYHTENNIGLALVYPVMSYCFQSCIDFVHYILIVWIPSWELATRWVSFYNKPKQQVIQSANYKGGSGYFVSTS